MIHGVAKGQTWLSDWTEFFPPLVKNPPAMQESVIWFLGQEDSLEKGKATHSSILAQRIPWTVKSMWSQRVGHNCVTFTRNFYLTGRFNHSLLSHSLIVGKLSSLLIIFWWRTWKPLSWKDMLQSLGSQSQTRLSDWTTNHFLMVKLI